MPQPFAANPFEPSFIELQSIDSTNNYALSRVHAGLARHGMAIFSHEQLMGRGQRGKSWVTGRDSSIILSLVVNPRPLALRQQFLLSACAALVVWEFFRNLAGSGTTIKWPNDLYWQDRKAGGILIENSISGSSAEGWNWAVIGIGININQTQFSPELSNAVSLKQITGKENDPLMLAKQLAPVFYKKLGEMIRSGDAESVLQEYNRHLYKMNQKVRLRKNNIIFEGTIVGVGTDGRLKVKQDIIEEYSVGEISFVFDT